jgi:hypothetical protein
VGVVFVVVVIAVLAVVGYLYLHQGQSTTVKNPNLPDGHASNMARDWFVNLPDHVLNFISTPRGGLIIVCTVIAVLLVSVWQRLGRVQVAVISIIGVIVICGGATLLGGHR